MSKREDVADIGAKLERAIKRLENLRAAEAGISTDGSHSHKRLSIWVGDIEIMIVAQESSGHSVRRGREIVALGIKKVLQGQIDMLISEIAVMKKKIADVPV